MYNFHKIFEHNVSDCSQTKCTPDGANLIILRINSGERLRMQLLRVASLESLPIHSKGN